jgi:lipopolysaccharide transport system permease protein
LPLAQALVIGLTLSRVVRFETKGGYALFVFAGTLPWTYFNGVLIGATTSIVMGSELATRVYFPRAVLPIVTILAGLRGFIPALAVLIGVAAIFHAPLGLDLLLLVPATALMVALTAGFSLVMAALQVYFRDMKFIVAAATLPWFWASGAIFPLDKLGSLRVWLEINPAVGMIEFFRAALGTASPGWGRSVWFCVAWTVVLLLVSLPLYKRYDRVFVDLL